MVSIQIGNTFRVAWRILTNNEAQSFEGRTIRLILAAPSGKPMEITPIISDTDAATLTFVFQGSDQKETGIYKLIIIENKGEASQALTDEAMAFRLVADSEDATPDIPEFGGDPSVTLDTGNLKIGWQGDSAYESWLRVIKPESGSDSEEDFIAWLRKPADDAATTALAQGEYAEEQGKAAAEAAQKANEATAAFTEDEKARAAAEAQRVSAENVRIFSENGRALGEDRRAAAESARVEAETQRASQENERIQAETERANTEQIRATAETERDTAETAREKAESVRAKAETARDNSEASRIDAENTRASNEKQRQANETLRESSEKGRDEAETSRINAESERVSTFQTMQSDNDTAIANANDAAAEARATFLSLNFSQETGKLSVTIGSEKSVFDSGRINPETGKIEMVFNY